jgi:hypothetical protein
MERKISVRDIRKIINEEKNEFKPKFGDGVETENKKNNNKTYKDTKEETGAKEVEIKHDLGDKLDGNKTTLDYELDNDPGQDYRKRVHAQTQGYTSTLEKDNEIEKIGEFDDSFYKAAKKAHEEMSGNKKELKKSGIQAKELSDKWFDKEDIYENKNLKTVRFKKTTFLTEEHMISRIPDEMKTEGNIFKMTDKNENTYIVEWKKDEFKNTSNAIILEHINNKAVNEELEKMKALYGFKHSTNYSKTTGQERINESNDAFASTLEKMRKIIK